MKGPRHLHEVRSAIEAHVEVAVNAASGQHIEDAARDAIAVRAARDVPHVWLIFNELPIAVGSTATIEAVCSLYYELRKSHHYGEHCTGRTGMEHR